MNLDITDEYEAFMILWRLRNQFDEIICSDHTKEWVIESRALLILWRAAEHISNTPTSRHIFGASIPESGVL